MALNTTFSPSINFARTEVKETSKSELLDKRIVRITGIGMIIFLIVFGVVIALHLFFVGMQKQVDSSIASVQSELTSLSNEQAKYLVFAQKLKLLQGIQEDRTIRKAALDMLYAIVPTEDVLKQVNLDQQKKVITFAVSTPDVFALVRLLQKLNVSPSTSAQFPMQLQDLTRSPDGTYTLNALLSFSSVGSKAKTQGGT